MFFSSKKGPFRLILPTTIYPINGKKHLCALCNTAASPHLFTCCYVWRSCLSPTNSEYIGGDKSTKSSLDRNNSKTNLIVYNKTKKMSKQQTQLLSWSQVILVSRFFVLCLSLLFFNITMKLYTAVN